MGVTLHALPPERQKFPRGDISHNPILESSPQTGEISNARQASADSGVQHQSDTGADCYGL
jgi:hypothetical protein